jgi:hypothetical protein
LPIPLICPGANQLHFLRAARLAGQKRAPNRLRLKANFVNGFKLIWVSSPDAKKYCFPKTRNCGSFHPSRLGKRGVRVVTNVGRDAMDAEVPLTSGAEADGEIVWS